ncbi:MAG TPA: hypothetical protein VGH38_33380 [Bryobacteraceae bacterium]
MKKWTLVDSALTPDGKTLSLAEHDGSYAIRIDGAELMSTRRHASEEKLAELACAHVGAIRNARVLVGGLGFGFTLRAALSMVAVDAIVVVAEILAPVISWNRNPEYPLAADVLADPRVVVRQQDVADAIRESPGGFDSIILDVDNGPVALSAAGNDRLYDPAGLKMARKALRPGGCVAFWSAAGDDVFAERLARAAFTVDVKRVRPHPNSGARHTIFLAWVK